MSRQSRSAPGRALFVVLAALWLAVLAINPPGGGSPPATSPPSTSPTTTAKVRNADGDTVKVTTPTAALSQASDGLQGHAEGSGDSKPPGVSQTAWEAGKAQRAAFAARDHMPTVVPLAAQSAPGCSTRLISRNYSSRNGVKPRLIVVHYTVSPNRPGWADVFAIVAWFNNAAAQASSNYVIDAEGHCALMVPEATGKAWAQVGFNSVAVSIEVVNTGKEPAAWAASQPALVKLIRGIAAREGIPLQRGAVSGCSVVRSGIVDHNQLGACGGGHFDVTPFSVAATVAKVKAASSAKAKAAAATCSKLRFHRRKLAALPKASKRTAAQAKDANSQVRQIQALKRHAKAIGLADAKCR